MNIKRIDSLSEVDIEPIIKDSIEDGHNFLVRLQCEYMNETNCFDKEGEVLFVVMLNEQVIGIGGLNQDPYIKDKDVGRVRHLYVMKKYRIKGIGNVLLEQMVNEGRKHFKTIRLRTNNSIADNMYCNFGFIKDNDEYSTHYMNFSNSSNDS